MHSAGGEGTARVELFAATQEQQPIVANLLELYTHDLSALFGVELGEDGRFGYRDLPLYWSEPGRQALLARIDGRLAGFSLIRRGSPATGRTDVWDMTEFFVIRAFRNRGIGTEMAHQVWRRFPGAWEVRVLEANHSALKFWEDALKDFAAQRVSAVSLEWHGKAWRVFSFQCE